METKMQLSKHNLANIVAKENLYIPAPQNFALPEKVLQFGTGVLLRALPDFIINRANEQELFNGRIVVVKSTSTGTADAFDTQDGLYTVCVRGERDGTTINEDHIIASVSRVIAAQTDWENVLAVAASPDLEIVISNTTEVGISLLEEDIHATPPASFPAKLLAVLYKRFQVFQGEDSKGLIIIPTELLTNNADKLLEILLQLSAFNKLEEDFINWLKTANHFCNSLVDRIVPGKMSSEEQVETELALGYRDELMIMSEAYTLWAIETKNEQVKKNLSFAFKGSGAVLTENIDKFRELKLRLLNGSHTFTCGLAYLHGFDTVKVAMKDEAFVRFISRLVNDEIIPSMINENLSAAEATEFAAEVLDRYRNDFIEHKWLGITMQYSTKMKMRNVQTMQNYTKRFSKAPSLMALGMAAHILFMECKKDAAGKYFGEQEGEKYIVNDVNADVYATAWKKGSIHEVVEIILSDKSLWETDLSKLNGFSGLVIQRLEMLQQKGIQETLKKIASEKIPAP